MISLELNNFRHWDKKVVTFESGTNRLEAPSGKGKTTILEAIYYCLYGSLNNVTSWKNPNKKANVRMKYGDIDIVRSGRNSVSLYKDTLLLAENSIAQSYICDFFGSSELFISMSYLRSESSHILLSGNVKDKRILSQLLFPEASKYNTYKERLESRISSVKNDIRILNSQKTRILGSLDIMEDLSSYIPIELPPIDISLSKEQVEILYKEYKDIPSVNVPLEPIEPLQERLYNSVIISDDLLPLEEVQKYNNITIEKIEQVYKAKNSPVQHSIEELQRRKQLPIAPYERNVIESLIENTTLEEQEELLLSLTEFCKNKEILSRSVTKENVPIDAIECPNCHIQFKDDVIYGTKEDNIIRKYIAQYGTPQEEWKLNGEKILRSVKERIYLLGLPKETITLRERDEISNEIDRYNLLKENEWHIHPKEYMLKVYSSLVHYNSSKNFVSREEYESLKEHIALLQQKKAYMDRRDMFIQKYEWIENSPEIISILDSREKNIKYYKWKSLQEELDIIQKKIIELEKLLTDYSRIDGSLTTTLNQYLNTRLNSINYELSEISSIFTPELGVMYITTGNEGTIVKPTLEFKIDGIPNLNLLSTGQRKRVSLAIMFVLCKQFSGKMMLLDEALNSFSQEMRYTIVEYLERLNIPIIITNHDDIPIISNNISLY